MDQKIDQQESPENRSNFYCEDGTVFIYSKERRLYEPYEKPKEDQDKTSAAEHNKSRNPFVKHWSKGMRFWITTSVSLLGVIVVGIYTFYARRQWCATQQAAIQARRSVNAAIEAMKLDERAWVAVTQIEPVKDCQWRAITFRNSGKSAALSFQVSGAAEPVLKGSRPTKPEQTLPGKGVIAPDSVFSDCIGDKQIDNFDWSNTDLVVHGRISYFDTFGTDHWTTFCYLRSENSGFSPCDFGNDMDKNGVRISE
jgi:hypothetical protein